MICWPSSVLPASSLPFFHLLVGVAAPEQLLTKCYMVVWSLDGSRKCFSTRRKLMNNKMQRAKKSNVLTTRKATLNVLRAMLVPSPFPASSSRYSLIFKIATFGSLAQLSWTMTWYQSSLESTAQESATKPPRGSNRLTYSLAFWKPRGSVVKRDFSVKKCIIMHKDLAP
ncbi:hypothetical protein C8J56DRAFT_385807 [Mycena floridula]|nr:hypothetical protein C8J56DRAFT_385807 [Mycena floridula]